MVVRFIRELATLNDGIKFPKGGVNSTLDVNFTMKIITAAISHASVNYSACNNLPVPIWECYTNDTINSQEEECKA